MVESVHERELQETGPEAAQRLGRRHGPEVRARIERALAVAGGVEPGPRYPGAVEVATLLDELGVDGDTLVAALLSTPEIAAVLPDERLEPEYGPTVATLARNARRLNVFRERGEAAREREPAERLRRMILALGEDVRAVLIRLAYRTCRLRRLGAEERDERRRIARETLDLYAPLANRLGVSQLKWEMEDLAFRYLDPQTYKQIATRLQERRSERERFVAEFTRELQAALETDGIENAQVHGRPKHIYSIWRKMQRKHVDLDELFDVHAVRVLVDEVRDCYAALGAVHSRWSHIRREFDDYIANPKSNGYQSLHTAVFGPGGKPVEIQIRTRQMNEHAERGVAAHWLYKEGSSEGARLQQSINALRSLLDSGGGDDSLQDSFGRELFADRVFVFTPRGDVMDMPQGATALDFAFQVHTNVGHRCRGAKVNGRIVPLTYQLQNGDQVEVLTTRDPNPSRDWLNRDLGYLNTSRARAKVRAWFNQQDHSQHVEEGRQLLERELKRLDARELPLEKLTPELGFARQADLFAALGRNELSSEKIARAVQNLSRPKQSDIGPIQRRAERVPRGDEAIRVRGVGNLMTQTANCCKPLPGDAVVGFITRGRGITVHRRDCHNILRLGERERDRLIEVELGGEEQLRRWNVDITVRAFERPDLLRDVTNVLAEDGINVIRADLDQNVEPPDARIEMTVQIRDLAQLNRALQRVSQLPNVHDAVRRGTA
ncbi:MAG: bifunctional (p)ppGpp synthetase/guanosine-3',5'-bis(diphosphate) 3'-pyrophosphohydrolase [Halofilum sp. (in: g-proteobacteria)]|nr:bifunctional (p)ppGpp synthetase/guanosine-3',5'-bis(diphosphate) 3'-pyrophosphohydrolase [Halofilum sp. (in: g-proteobacteria)]